MHSPQRPHAEVAHIILIYLSRTKGKKLHLTKGSSKSYEYSQMLTGQETLMIESRHQDVVVS